MAKKVMVVDDSSTIRQQVGVALGRAGYEVVEACDGVDAIEKITSHSDIAIVICDVNMPRMNGIELLGRMPKAGAAPVPVVMLTTEAQPSLIARAKEGGAKGWIIKPFKPELLLSAVRKLVGDG